MNSDAVRVVESAAIKMGNVAMPAGTAWTAVAEWLKQGDNAVMVGVVTTLVGFAISVGLQIWRAIRESRAQKRADHLIDVDIQYRRTEDERREREHALNVRILNSKITKIEEEITTILGGRDEPSPGQAT